MCGLRKKPRHHHCGYQIRVRPGWGRQSRPRRWDAHTRQLPFLASWRVRAGARPALLRQTVCPWLAQGKPGQWLDAAGGYRRKDDRQIPAGIWDADRGETLSRVRNTHWRNVFRVQTKEDTGPIKYMGRCLFLHWHRSILKSRWIIHRSYGDLV